MKQLYKNALAEGIGTLVLVLIGTGVAVMTSSLVFINVNMLYTALAFGLTVMAMAYAFGGVSGGHFNPAVSFAMFLKKKLSLNDLIVYVVAQLVGGLIGSLLLVIMLDSNASLGSNVVSANLPYEGFALLFVGLLIETVMTFIFVTVIIRTTRSKENSPVAGLIIGLTLTVIILFGFNLTGVGVNPVRSIAPAIFQGGVALEQVWVFIVGPLLGGALAAFVSKVFE